MDDLVKLEGVSKGMKINGKDTFDCETCILGKQVNTRNRTPDTRATYPIELVHTDLAGPIDPIAKDGFKYVIVFTDDFSACYFTYFLRNKSDAVVATNKFLIDIKPFGKVRTLSFYNEISPSGGVVRLRSENGGEYSSQEFVDLLLKHGINHELSCPNSPHQNGTAERSWRTLFDMGRSMLIEAGLPKYLWTFAIMAATYVRNRCYSQRICNTPFGLITNLKPDLKNLHVFGTICYAYVHDVKKLDPRSRKGYFLGYDKERPSYLVYFPEFNSVRKHRIVKFTDKFELPSSNPQKQLLSNNDVSSGFIQDVNTSDAILDDVQEVPDEVGNNAGGRYPTRDKQRPPYLDDYASTVRSSDNVMLDYCYLMNVPRTYREAINDSHSAEWKQAMDDEMDSLKHNNTFETTMLPPDQKAVGGRWVFTIKGHPEIDDKQLYKARYVARGCSQIHGVDNLETFSPTARMESVRILMQVSVQTSMVVHQMDVKSAHLHAPFEHRIYVSQPECYEKMGDGGQKLVWKLKVFVWLEAKR